MGCGYEEDIMDIDNFLLLLLFPICFILAVAAAIVWTVFFGPQIVAEKLIVRQSQKQRRIRR